MRIAEFDEPIDVTRLISLKTYFVGLAAIATDPPEEIAAFGLQYFNIL
jgi:hypothetical protein